MTISERIFEKLHELDMSQKTFSEQTGIRQSTISEWKKKKTNPTSEKIMSICKALDVSPEWLLSGAESRGDYRNQSDWFVIGKDSEVGYLVKTYNSMSARSRARLQGYMESLADAE